MRDMMLILNFDDTGSRAIAKGLRAERIYCKIVAPTISLEEVMAQEPLGLILAGSLSGSASSGLDTRLLQSAFPILAMGDTAAMLCRELGGEAQETVLCNRIDTVTFFKCPLTQDMDDCERVLRNVRRLCLPDSLRVLAEAQDEVVGFMHRNLPLYGLQFMLEQNDTDGMHLLLNFVLTVCGCTRWWDYDAFISRTVEEIRRVVGDGRAVCAMTGGLNSGVSAMLAHRALGEQLQCVFIDTGLLREKEGSNFLSFYRDQAGISITHVQAQERFAQALSGIDDPDEKRRRIGQTLQETLDETLSQLGEFAMVIRGTTSDDLLSGRPEKSKPAALADVPIIEPLRELFKDEVRLIAQRLNMPAEIIAKQSFPGSGLALRILGRVTPARLQTLRAADQIFNEEILSSGQGKRLLRHFAVLSPIMGDDAHYMIVLRAVNASDAAQHTYAARIPYDLLERITERILRERPEVARVVYDLSPLSRSGSVEWQ